MKKYLVCTGLAVLSLLNSKNANSMELDIHQLTQLLKTHAGQQFFGKMLTEKLDEDDFLEEINPIEQSLHFVPVKQQKTLDIIDIIANTIGELNYIFSINFDGIEACTPYTSQLESIVHRR